MTRAQAKAIREVYDALCRMAKQPSALGEWAEKYKLVLESAGLGEREPEP